MSTSYTKFTMTSNPALSRSKKAYKIPLKRFQVNNKLLQSKTYSKNEENYLLKGAQKFGSSVKKIKIFPSRNACKKKFGSTKTILSQRKINRKSSDLSFVSIKKKFGMRKPFFGHPKKKVLDPE